MSPVVFSLFETSGKDGNSSRDLNNAIIIHICHFAFRTNCDPSQGFLRFVQKLENHFVQVHQQLKAGLKFEQDRNTLSCL